MIQLKYQSLVESYDTVITYAMRTCNCFSVITKQKKPYSKIPPCCEYDLKMDKFQSYLIHQIIGIRKWSNAGVNDNHTVMNVYQCCKGARNAMLTFPCIFLPEKNQIPEDICFYRRNVVWLSTISHEKIAYIYYETEEDLDFLKRNGIMFSRVLFPNKPYILPMEL